MSNWSYDPGAKFDDKGANGYWWISTEYRTNNEWAIKRLFGNDWAWILRNDMPKSFGASVRCVKD